MLRCFAFWGPSNSGLPAKPNQLNRAWEAGLHDQGLGFIEFRVKGLGLRV